MGWWRGLGLDFRNEDSSGDLAEEWLQKTLGRMKVGICFLRGVVAMLHDET